MKKTRNTPVWLCAAIELDADLSDAPDRALAIDQAAQRRAVQPDVVRRQLRCLAYVRRRSSIERVHANQSVVECLIGIERIDVPLADVMRERALQGDIKITELRSELARLRRDLSRTPEPTVSDLIARCRRDLSAELYIVVHQNAGVDQVDASWVGADLVSPRPVAPEERIWTWLGIVSPTVRWSCLRASPVQQFGRCVMAATLWADNVSAFCASPQEASLIRHMLIHVPSPDRSRIALHDLRAEYGAEWLVDPIAH